MDEAKKPKQDQSIRYVPVEDDGLESNAPVKAKVIKVEDDPVLLADEVELEFEKPGKNGNANDKINRRKIPYSDKKEPGSWHHEGE